MASASARRSRLAKAVPVREINIAKRATRMHSANLVRFYPTTPAKLGSARPNTDCLAASNGVCTKRNTARFGLLLVENEVNNNSQT